MKRKKLGLIILCFIMLFSLNAYAKKPSKATVKKAYKQYLSKTGIAIRGGKAVYVDINRDGIQELFYARSSNLTNLYKKCIVCTYKKGTVIKAGEFEGVLDMSYSSKKKRLCVGQRAAVGSWTSIYKLSNGILKKTVSYHPGMGADFAYKNNYNKKISVKEYSNAIKKYSKWRKLKINWWL